MRVSILAISTLSTLIAITLQRLTYSAVTDQFVPPEGAKPEGEDPTKAKQADDLKPIAAVALPEVVVPQNPTLTQSTAPDKRVSHPLPAGMMALLPVPGLPGDILPPLTIHTASEEAATSLLTEQGAVQVADQSNDRQMQVATNQAHPALLAMTEPPTAVAMLPDVTQGQGGATETTIAQTNAIAATVPQPTSEAVPALGDIQGHWAQPVIEALVQRGAIKGYGDGSFRPDAPITAKQFESMVKQGLPDAAIAYKELQAFNPRATRAEAAVFLYQSLIKAGQAPMLQTASASVAKIAAILAAANASSNPDATLPTPATGGLAAIPPATVEVPVAATTQADAAQIDAVQADAKVTPKNAPVDRERVAAVPLPSPSPTDEVNQIPDLAAQRSLPLAPSALPSSLPAVEGNPGFLAPGKANGQESGDPQAPGLVEAAFPNPTDTMAALESDYTLGAGDRLHLAVSGAPEDSGNYDVLTDGTLNLPQLGSIAVQGMTVQQASAAIAMRYAALLPQAEITLNLLMVRPMSVAIAGAVNRPGSYTLPLQAGNKFPTLIQAIRLAGGITHAADLRQVQIRRPQADGAEQQFTLNLWALSQTGTPEQDLTLRNGDRILIPSTVATTPDYPSQTEPSAQATANFNN